MSPLPSKTLGKGPGAGIEKKISQRKTGVEINCRKKKPGGVYSTKQGTKRGEVKR